MRLWHVQLLPYLPAMQFNGQLRELVAAMRDWRDKGSTNHLLINKVMEYPKSQLLYYFREYEKPYIIRNHRTLAKYRDEFERFAGGTGEKHYRSVYKDWHNTDYLRICMANLYEKYLGVGRSKISDKEWEALLGGYYDVIGEGYIL